MTYGKSAVLLLELIVSWCVIYVLQLPLRKRERPVLRTAVFIVKAVLIPVIALFFVAIANPLEYLCGGLMVAVYLALLGDTAASVVEYTVRRIRRGGAGDPGKSPCLMPLTGILSLAFCLGIFLYGTLNAGFIREKGVTYTAEGLTQTHTFAFVSDIHAGSAQSGDTLRDLCRAINAAAPEFVILGGDVTDELTSREQMQETYQILSEIEAPVYFIYGNHDRQPGAHYTGGRSYQDGELTDAIEGAGIRILSDEYVKISEDLILLGREDISADSRRPWEDLRNPYEGEGALVVADHQPYDKEQLRAEVSALQISGHTHAGQLFPLEFIYRIIGLPTYGEFEEPGTTLFVSSGANDWMIPIRTERRCEWILVTLQPE